MKLPPANGGSHSPPLTAPSGAVAERVILNKQDFHRIISQERKRSERSRKPFVLMLLDMGERAASEDNGKIRQIILNVLSRVTRETDVIGSYEDHSVVGVIFTEIVYTDYSTSVDALRVRVSAAMHSNLSIEQFNQLVFSFHAFPEDWNGRTRQRPSNPKLYPDLTERDHVRKRSRAIKRAMDIVGAITLLLMLSPIFVIIAIAIKVTSKGPILFQQRRSGLYGVPFPLLKFRSMHANCNTSAHREYVQQLIAGAAHKNPSKTNTQGVYKLTSDPRITAVGAFLRKTSLDELPQLINVVRGEMSLVGPRPPIDYEVANYDLWHRRRLMEAKPGITGLWQVAGRNRIPFDEMVRLDLTYSRSWSPWLDLKILLRTPKAVIEGAH